MSILIPTSDQQEPGDGGRDIRVSCLSNIYLFKDRLIASAAARG
jgi:hypothetical protein